MKETVLSYFKDDCDPEEANFYMGCEPISNQQFLEMIVETHPDALPLSMGWDDAIIKLYGGKTSGFSEEEMNKRKPWLQRIKDYFIRK